MPDSVDTFLLRFFYISNRCATHTDKCLGKTFCKKEIMEASLIISFIVMMVLQGRIYKTHQTHAHQSTTGGTADSTNKKLLHLLEAGN